MAPRRSLGILLSLSAGCGGSRVIELPSDLGVTELVAAAAVAPSGEPVALSGISELGGAALELEVESIDGLAIDLYAWPRAALPGFADALAARAPLTVAGACDAPLPAPLVLRRLDGDGAPIAQRLVSPTVPSERCLPGWSSQLGVEIRCLTASCLPFVHEEGCAATVDLQGCNGGRYVVHPTGGTPCVTPEDIACSASRPLEPEGLELSCTLALGDCALRFYDRDDPGWGTIERASVLDVPAAIPSNLRVGNVVEGQGRTGYLGTVFALGGARGVVDYDGRYRRENACGSPLPDRVSWLDEALRVTRSSTIPPCNLAVLTTADGARAYGVSAKTSTITGVELGVFELLPDGRTIPRFSRHFPASEVCGAGPAILSPDDRTIIVGHCVGPPHGEERGALWLIDTSRFELEDLPLRYDGHLVSMSFEGEILVVLGDLQDVVAWIDPRARALRAYAEVPSLISLSSAKVLSDAARELVYVAVPGEDAGVYVYERRSYASHTMMFQDDWAPMNLARLGEDQTVVSGLRVTEDGRWVGGLARISAEEQGVIPGVVELGESTLGSWLREPDGALLAALPWTGEVVRVRPRD